MLPLAVRLDRVLVGWQVLLAGGPGALFWMWITALFGMVISFAEAVLGQLYHEKVPMGTLRRCTLLHDEGTSQQNIGLPLCSLYGLYHGDCHCYAPDPFYCFGCDRHLSSSYLGPWYWRRLLTALVVLGGVKRITETASLVVPFMAVIYLLGVIYIVITHFAQIPALLRKSCRRPLQQKLPLAVL